MAIINAAMNKLIFTLFHHCLRLAELALLRNCSASLGSVCNGAWRLSVGVPSCGALSLVVEGGCSGTLFERSIWRSSSFCIIVTRSAAVAEESESFIGRSPAEECTEKTSAWMGTGAMFFLFLKGAERRGEERVTLRSPLLILEGWSC